ncbi:MAG: amidohydrolase [Oscillospiraceae bacterium]|nr:amidohydrolase [Oscillospiraceae bacterium]
MKNTILTEALEMKAFLINHRRWLHGHAETGFDLNETKAYVRRVLEEAGCVVSDCGRCGLVTTIGNPQKGACFLLRADMDALPIREESDADYACTTGNMHACGHDLHTAMLLGAAWILKKHEHELNGSVRLMFQPAEEIFGGARDMIENGILDGTDAGMMLHVSTGIPIPAGTLLIAPPGVSAPAADYFSICVHGKGCHGSAPQEGIDALTAAAHILIALQEINSRELGIHDAAMITIGTMNAGSAANAIADSAVMGGTIRCFDEDIRAKLKQRIEEISSGIASAFRSSANVTFDSSCPTLMNDPSLCDFTERCLADLLGPDKALAAAKLNPSGKPSAGGSEDFAYVSHKIPIVMVSLAAGEPVEGHVFPLHHPKATFDESAMPHGTAGLAYMAISYLQNH